MDTVSEVAPLLTWQRVFSCLRDVEPRSEKGVERVVEGMKKGAGISQPPL